ncbi:MAG: hypothetical protein ACFCBW_06655 [Candidatus Competibacterales bacterium]
MPFGYTIVCVPDVPAAGAFHQAALGREGPFVHDSGFYAELATSATALAFAT